MIKYTMYEEGREIESEVRLGQPGSGPVVRDTPVCQSRSAPDTLLDESWHSSRRLGVSSRCSSLSLNMGGQYWDTEVLSRLSNKVGRRPQTQ